MLSFYCCDYRNYLIQYLVVLNSSQFVVLKLSVNMTTEEPMRIVYSGGAGKWVPPPKGNASSISIVVTDKLDVLHRGRNIHSRKSYVTPYHSGDAPPSMEGSFASGDLTNQQSLSKTSSAVLCSRTEKLQPDYVLQSDPFLSKYGHFNAELNSRLHPPPISEENFQLEIHTGISSSSWRSPSLEGHGCGSMYMPRSSLSIHDEEPGDGSSAKEGSDDKERGISTMLRQTTFSFGGHRRSLGDHMQEDFPHTSQVFSKSHSLSKLKEPLHQDLQKLSLDSLCLKASKSSETISGVESVCQIEISPGSTATKEPLVAFDAINSHLGTQDQFIASKQGLPSKDAYFTSNGTMGPDPSISLDKRGRDQDNQELGFNEPNDLHMQNSYSQGASDYCLPRSQIQGTGQTINQLVPDDHVKTTSNEMWPLTQVSGVPPSIFAATAAYMAPGGSLDGNFGASGLYNPQYCGYTMAPSYLPPYLSGYSSPPTGFQWQFNANPGQTVFGQSVHSSYGESTSGESVIQNFNKNYGHHGLMMQTTVPDPISLQYSQQSLQDPYGVTFQYSYYPSPGMISRQVNSFGLQNDAAAAVHIGGKLQLLPIENASYPNPHKMSVPYGSYLSSPSGSRFGPQFPMSSLSSQVLPEFPPGCATSMRRQYDDGFSQSFSKSVVDYSRWKRQRGIDSINNHQKHSFLEELKANSAKSVNLSDIFGSIVEFSVDQHGSRFIQQKLETCSVDEKELVLKEILPHASTLIKDVFGNYVIQKFFEHGTNKERKELASQLSGKMLPLSLQMYGCRVIQKALEAIEADQKTELVLELDGHVMRCVQDQNGNHVIQKCIECIPIEKIDFLISAFRGQVAVLSTHPYGCRVIQRVLEHCSEDLQCQAIVDEILESAYELAKDQYGNYIIQHLLAKGKPYERSHIISKLKGKIVKMSHHKYASNVVEKCLEFGDPAERKLLIEEILVQSDDNDNLLTMMKDQFANYVVQKMLEISNNEQREKLLDRIQLHLLVLKKYTYGKHIAARFEQLAGEVTAECNC